MEQTSAGMLFKCYVFLLAVLFVLCETRITQDFCLSERAVLNCPDSHIIKVSLALYGRMKDNSRCISQRYNAGCQDDVTEKIQASCWGRKNCSFAVRDFVDLKPCPDLTSYLEVQYSCAPAISLSHCGTEITLQSDKGYLTLPTYSPRLSSPQCTWTLLVNKTQHLSLTVEPITTDTTRLCSSSVAVSEFRERGGLELRWQSISGCPDGDSHYQSKSSKIQLGYKHQMRKNEDTPFLLHYKVYGCPEIRPPAGGWVSQNSTFGMVKCNVTAETWYFTCKDTEWNGSAGNCTHQAGRHNEEDPGEDAFPFSIVMAIFLGLLLGIVVGGLLLGLVYFYFWYKRKPKADYQTPDIAGSYYSEDPSHKEMYSTSLDTRHQHCDYSQNYQLHNTCPAHAGSTAATMYGKYTGIISDGQQQGVTHTTLPPHPDELYQKRQYSEHMNT